MRVQFVTRRPPEPVRGGAMLRTGALTRAVVANGHVAQVFALAEHAPSRQGTGWLPRPDALPSDDEWSPQARADLRALLDAEPPDVAVIEGVTNRVVLDLLRGVGAKVVYDAHNVEGQLAEDLLTDDAPRITRIVAGRIAQAERALVAEVDAVWACSVADRDAFVGMGARQACTVPNVVPVSPLAPDEARIALRVLFTGMFSYGPNRRAVGHLLEIVPRLGPGATLVLAGADPPRDLPDVPWLTVTGALDSMDEELRRATVLAVPLDVGGGTRFKVLEAMAAGLPVVSTAKGVEGLGLEDGEHVVLAESADDFVHAIQGLADDPARRRRLVQAAHERVRDHHSDGALAPMVRAALTALTVGAGS